MKVGYGQAIAQRGASAWEVVFISFTLLTLPLFEAPKNVFIILFLASWVVRFVRIKSMGAPCVLNWPILGLALILWVSPVFSPHSDVITILNSAPRWTLLALFVTMASRLDYSRGQLQIIWTALMIGGMVAVAESFWVWHFNGKSYPEFRSVGHVNHSSMYTLIPLAAGLGALFTANKWLKILGYFAIGSTLVFLPPSRSLVGGVAVCAVLIAAVYIRTVPKWRVRGLLFSIVAGVGIVSTILMTPYSSGFRSELAFRLSSDNIFSGRDRILNSAMAVWEQHPILGTGFDSFGVATSERAVRAALEADGLEYFSNVYWHFPHGHNLWVTMLIERGLIGVGLITLVLFLYFRTFCPIACSRERLDPVDRGAAVGALLVFVGFVVAGLGNTTMMNEHGHAGMAFIAIAYGYLRGRGIINSGQRISS